MTNIFHLNSVFHFIIISFEANQIPDDYLYPAEFSIQDFLYIRSEWDFFVSNSENARSVPVEWIEPNQNPNEEWSKYATQLDL